MTQTIRVNANNPAYEDMISAAMTAMKPENLRIAVRSKKNRKENIPPIERFGLCFYVAGILQDATAFKGRYSPEDMETAIKNTEKAAVIGTMFEILTGAGKSVDEWEFNGDAMTILTTSDKSNGAGVLFCDDILRKIHEKIGDFYILPSSIHEVIIVPYSSEFNMEELEEMVKAVNQTEVDPAEQLADCVFIYDGKLH